MLPTCSVDKLWIQWHLHFVHDIRHHFGSVGRALLNQPHRAAGNEEIENNLRGNEESKDDDSSSIGVSIGGLVLGLMLPYLCFFILVAITKSCRKRQLTNYVAEWNRWCFSFILFWAQKSFSRTRGNGVALSFGGGGTTPRVWSGFNKSYMPNKLIMSITSDPLPHKLRTQTKV